MAVMELYTGERFRVWVIRRGWHFWTGTKWEIAPYTAKCFGQKKDAEAYVARRRLEDSNGDQVQVRSATLTLNA